MAFNWKSAKSGQRVPGDSISDNKYKVVLLGDMRVGKSSILSCLVQSRNPVGRVTTSPTSAVHTVAVGNKNISMEIWDTAGQDRFRSVTRMYYRKARAVLVVFDITNRDSLTIAQQWVEELREESSTQDAVIVLVGNKVDCAQNRRVQFEEVDDYARKQRLMFMESSAKTGRNVEKIFQDIAGRLAEQDSDNLKHHGFKLNQSERKRIKVKCCS